MSIASSQNEEQEEETEAVNTVIFDLGSYSCKVGFAASNHNEIETLSVIGFPKNDIDLGSELLNKEELYIGSEAIVRSPLLNLKYPID